MIATQVRLASDRYHEVGATVHDRNAQAASALRALGSPWGDDAEGAAFAQHYLPTAEGAQHAVALVADALTGVAATLTRSFATTQAGDGAIGAALDGLRPAAAQPPGEGR